MRKAGRKGEHTLCLAALIYLTKPCGECKLGSLLEVNKTMPMAGDYLSEENEHSAHYAQMMRYPVDIYLFF